VPTTIPGHAFNRDRFSVIRQKNITRELARISVLKLKTDSHKKRKNAPERERQNDLQAGLWPAELAIFFHQHLFAFFAISRASCGLAVLTSGYGMRLSSDERVEVLGERC